MTGRQSGSAEGSPPTGSWAFSSPNPSKQSRPVTDIFTTGTSMRSIYHAVAGINEGEERRLIITQPPRSLKSICTSVAFVAWSLGHDPSKRFACVSYSRSLPPPLRVNSAPSFRAIGIGRFSPACGSPRTPRPNA